MTPHIHTHPVPASADTTAIEFDRFGVDCFLRSDSIVVGAEPKWIEHCYRFIDYIAAYRYSEEFPQPNFKAGKVRIDCDENICCIEYTAPVDKACHLNGDSIRLFFYCADDEWDDLDDWSFGRVFKMETHERNEEGETCLHDFRYSRRGFLDKEAKEFIDVFLDFGS